MNRSRILLAGVGCAALLYGCGGGGEAAPAAAPPPPPPVELSLNAANYQNALSFALESANAGFGFAKLGADVADRLFNKPLLLTLLFPCPVSGSASIELTDRNRNGMLNANDALHIFLSSCNSDVNPLTGTVRVEVVSAAETPDGREYQLLVQVNDLVITSTVAGTSPVTINFAGTVNFTRGVSFDHYVLSFGDYEFVRSAETRSATDLLVDYLQRYDTLGYDYLVQGTVGGSVIQGQYRVNTPLPLTGIIGAFPGAGRLTLNGGSSSIARLSEEGNAATDGNTVLVAVDANGDGTADATVSQFAWTSLLPAQIFGSLRDQADVAELPIP